VIVCGLIVVALQQMGALQSPPPPVPTQTVQAPAAGDQPELATKMMVRLSEWLGNDPKNASMMVGNTLHPESEPGNVHAFRDSLTRAYFFGSQGWQSELDGLTKPLVPWSFEGADEDAKIVASILRGESVSDEARARLAERHGFYGKLAGVLDKPATDPTRAALLAGGGRLVAVLAGLGMLLLGVFLAALVCSIVAAINLLARDATLRVRWRLDVPAVGGSVLLETVAVFVAGFCALKLVLAGLEAVLPEAQHGVLGTVAMTLQWALILTPLWALTQGVSWAQLRQLLGLHKGEGLFKEIGCGLFAYFAGLPLVFVAIVVSLIAILVQGLVSGPGGGAPSNPIAELVTSAGAFELFMLFALASIWAPLVEETIFRGAFYRHIRGKRGVVLSGVVSAVLFAVMHGYPFFLLAPVTVLGFNFAMMREWRGSLVAPIVMHSLHNATTLIVVVSLMRSMM
jgi:membrane protease YdiL (CAAX protease family)